MTERIEQILDDDAIATLKRTFEKEEMQKILEETLPAVYPPSERYVDAIAEFYRGLVARDERGPRHALSVPDRERIVLALLASRGGGYPFALHVYLGLILDITPAEVANILLLTGIYTGVNVLATCLLETAKTLSLLKKRIDDQKALNPAAINGALRKAFRVD